MANKFLFTFSAVDKTASVFKKVNTSFSRSEKLTEKLTKQSKLAAKAGGDMNKAFGGQQGDPFARFREAGAEVEKVNHSIFDLAGALSPIAGAALAAAGAVAAVAVAWGKSGVALTNTATQADVSVKTLQSWRAVATGLGLDADDASANLKSVAHEMNEIAMGRDQLAAGINKNLGINIRKTADGLYDVDNYMQQLAAHTKQFIDEGNTQGAVNFLSGQGISSSMLPMMKLGADAIDKLREAARKMGDENDKATASSLKLGQAIGGLKNAWQGFSNNAQQLLAPSLTGGVNALSGALSGDPKSMLKGLLQYETLGIFDGNSHAAGSGQTMSGKLRAEGSGGSTLGLRSNNPMNLEPAGNHRWFGSTQEGLEAGISNLVRNYSGMTLDAARSKYATATGAAHDNAVGIISKASGIGRGEVPNLQDLQVLVGVVMGIIQAENGKNSITKDQVTAAAQHVLVTLHAPPGTTATATQGGKVAPVRIVHAMSPTS